jgi:hypothetical protein
LGSVGGEWRASRGTAGSDAPIDLRRPPGRSKTAEFPRASLVSDVRWAGGRNGNAHAQLTSRGRDSSGPFRRKPRSVDQ